MLKKIQSGQTGKAKVTFVLSSQSDADHIHVTGDFNDWQASTPMRRQKDGSFRATVELEPGREYQFRYLVDGNSWVNDEAADAYYPNPFGADNSVVRTPEAGGGRPRAARGSAGERPRAGGAKAGSAKTAGAKTPGARAGGTRAAGGASKMSSGDRSSAAALSASPLDSGAAGAQARDAVRVEGSRKGAGGASPRSGRAKPRGE